MKKQKVTKSVYFVEETQNIEGAYVEVNTLLSLIIKNKLPRSMKN